MSKIAFIRKKVEEFFDEMDRNFDGWLCFVVIVVVFVFVFVLIRFFLKIYVKNCF